MVQAHASKMAPDARPMMIAALSDDTEEVRSLVASLGFPIDASFVQRRSNPDNQLWVGSGKVREIRDHVRAEYGIWRKPSRGRNPFTSSGESDREEPPTEFRVQGPSTDVRKRLSKGPEPILLLVGEMKPTHKFNLEDVLGVEVWDRTRLILEIFSRRAGLKEARLQVELAQLRYEAPMAREAVHRMKSGERPGYMGGGEYASADFEQAQKKRLAVVRAELEKVRGERAERRKVRHEAFHLVSLAGYTNAGKSRLLNALTGEHKEVENRMFTTLSTATRRVAYERFQPTTPGLMERPMLLTDTVGFIRDLPAWLLDAFHSTLEEIALADVVLLTIDVSEPLDEIASKLAVCQKELAHLQVTVPVVTALNKADLLSPEELKVRLRDLERLRLIDPERALPVSAARSMNLGQLVELLHDQLPPPRRLVVELPNDAQGASVLSTLHGMMRVDNTRYGDVLHVEGVTDPLRFHSIVSTVRKNRGEVRVVS